MGYDPTEPTPRTDAEQYRNYGADREWVVPADFARSLERSLARKEALLLRWVESAKRDDVCDLTCLIIESERELEGK
jgi:hypothetical protein